MLMTGWGRGVIHEKNIDDNHPIGFKTVCMFIKLFHHAMLNDNRDNYFGINNRDFVKK